MIYHPNHHDFIFLLPVMLQVIIRAVEHGWQVYSL